MSLSLWLLLLLADLLISFQVAVTSTYCFRKLWPLGLFCPQFHGVRGPAVVVRGGLTAWWSPHPGHLTDVRDLPRSLPL